MSDAGTKEYFLSYQPVKESNQQQLEEAMKSYEKSIHSMPTSDAYYNLANVQYSMGKAEAAIKSWAKSLEIDPNLSDAHVNTANVLALQMREFERALSHYEAAIRLQTQDGQIRFNYAAVLESAGRLDDAAEAYKQAINLGVDRANQNLRNVQAKIIAEKAKSE